MLYIITYDINTNFKNYASLYECIQKLGDSYQHPLESVWVISSERNVTEICNRPRQEMNEKDLLFVAELKKDSAVQGWLNKTFWKWLKQKIHTTNN